MGDPAGVGLELTGAAWRALRASGPCFVLIAPNAVAQTLDAPTIQVEDPQQAMAAFPDALPVMWPHGAAPDTPPSPGAPEPAWAPAVTAAIETSVALSLAGRAAGVITNPIAKHVLYDAGFALPGHTEYLGDLTANAPKAGPRGPVMMLTGGGLRVALVTIHEPLAKVPGLLSPQMLERCVRVTRHALGSDFGVQEPRIALCGLNPHAGEAGALGDEEHTLINPTAQRLREAGIDVTNAQAADSLFAADMRSRYDAIVAMYHDQGLIPVKTLDFHRAVNVTLGLPIVRTSPDHGTAFGIAGKGIARPDSLIAAIELAGAMASRRLNAALAPA